MLTEKSGFRLVTSVMLGRSCYEEKEKMALFCSETS